MDIPVRRYPEAEAIDSDLPEIQTAPISSEEPSCSRQDSITLEEKDKEDELDAKCNTGLANFLKCGEAINLYMEAYDNFRKEILKPKSSLFKLEDTLLSLATNHSVDGIYYFVSFEFAENFVVSRQFESGCFYGYGIKKTEEVFGYKVLVPIVTFTQNDIFLEKERNKDVYKDRRKSELPHNHTFKRLIYTNKNSIENSVKKIHVELQTLKQAKLLNLFVLVLHANQRWKETLDKKGKSVQRFCFSYPESSALAIEGHLMQYRSNPNTETNICIWNEISHDLSVESQFMILNSISNFHKWPWKDGYVKQVLFEEKFPNTTRVYPASPRHRILQALQYRKNPAVIIYDVLMNLAGRKTQVRYESKKRKRMEMSESELSTDETEPLTASETDASTQADTGITEVQHDEIVEDHVEDDPANVADTGITEVQHDEIVEDHVEDDPANVVFVDASQPRNVSLYDFFTSELFHRGVIFWRIREENREVVIMNTYHPETGNFQNYEYCKVHVDSDGITCSCQSFSISLMSNEQSCCHTRLLNEIQHGNHRFNMLKINDGMKMATTNIVQLPSKSGVDRFSVNCDNDTEFVTLFNVAKTNRTIVTCHSSICKIAEGSTRNVKYLEKSEHLCGHLSTFRDFYLDQLKAQVEGYENGEDVEFDPDDEIPSTLPDEKWQDVFDELTGKWKFAPKSPSQNTVDDDPFSESLKKHVSLRSEISEFKPKLAESCGCGAGWSSDEFPDGILKVNRTSSVYSSFDVHTCTIYDRWCLDKNCVMKWDGSEESIFCSSRIIAAGYEIGWEFVDLVMASHQTFRGFVTVMNNRYKRFSSSSSFMAVNSFIDWFFGWASRMNLEFRQGCEFCNGSPKVLACDGTKLGMGFRNYFVKPIESASSNVSDNFIQLRRHDRCFITNSASSTPDDKRRFQLARSSLGDIADNVLKTFEVDVSKRDFVRPYVPLLCQSAFDRMLSDDTEEAIKKSIAAVFKLLSSDCALDTLIPLVVCSDILELDESRVQQLACALRLYSPTCASLVLACSDSPALKDVLLLLKYCAKFVVEIHSKDIPPASPSPIIGSYNPPKNGRAYYFSDHGCQIRDMRSFPVDKRSGNFDDSPDVLCNKRFPQVSKQGISYLFLWFCPQHGHCFGFHVIPSSEGRKDAAASLYTHLEIPPEVLLYDFACSLSEYSKNREAGYFKHTRFYHDFFHGYTHKCSRAFRCDKLPGFANVNTSICEQFNAFIKKIETSSRLMSQSHFTFYLQFFIHMWNKQKKDSFMKKLFISKASQQ